MYENELAHVCLDMPDETLCELLILLNNNINNCLGLRIRVDGNFCSSRDIDNGMTKEELLFRIRDVRAAATEEVGLHDAGNAVFVIEQYK